MKLVEKFEVTKEIVAGLEMSIAPLAVSEHKTILVGTLEIAQQMKKIEFVESVYYNSSKHLMKIQLKEQYSFHLYKDMLFIIESSEPKMVGASIID